MSLILIVLLIALIAGAVPVYPYNQSWGYGPSGVLGAILLVIIVLVVLGRV